MKKPPLYFPDGPPKFEESAFARQSRINLELMTSPSHQGRRCADCARGYGETVLNIEAMIHHRARQPLCIDRKECERAKRKS